MDAVVKFITSHICSIYQIELDKQLEICALLKSKLNPIYHLCFCSYDIYIDITFHSTQGKFDPIALYFFMCKFLPLISLQDLKLLAECDEDSQSAKTTKQSSNNICLIKSCPYDWFVVNIIKNRCSENLDQ
ncbi:hypothetical protein SS50377_25031 [Spironucleus salmonicida]|uniref:Uncharacterized protein n=1 Tax=Spironucleus salmonicida TaxID=348837 RepID=A0A9P8RXS1_9EUKA|nr:hypothetical protein SS50377_25031 [Spironucleus salmonicida]